MGRALDVAGKRAGAGEIIPPLRFSRGMKTVLGQIEALVLRAYPDGEYTDPKTGKAKTLYSAGFGRNSINDKRIKPGFTITVPEAFQMLDEDLREREKILNGMLKRLVTQHEFDALGIMLYQSGNRYVPALVHLINYGANDLAAEIWPEFDRNSRNIQKAGLRIRREREQKIFRDGDYGDLNAPIKLWRGDPHTTQPEPYVLQPGDIP